MVILSDSVAMAWLSQRFELSRGTAESNLIAMEGLRGVAVSLVFLVHYSTLVQPWLTSQGGVALTLDALHRIGNAGVDLFFVLSGNLIYGHLIAKPQPFRIYIARRAQRIYPAFLAVFSAYVVLSFLYPSAGKLPDGAIATVVYLVQNLMLLPGLLPIRPLITVAWSLSYEMFYYLVMPGVIAVFALRSRAPGWRIALFAVSTLVALVAFGMVGGPVRLTMFLAGVLVYETLPRGYAPSSSVAWIALALCLAAMLLPMPGPAGQSLRTAILFAGFFVLCRCCFGQPRQSVARTFRWTPLRWLGNMSYSYYLTHGLTLKMLFVGLGLVLPPGGTGDLGALLIVPAFALTLAPSTLLFLWVERPFSLQPRRSSRAGPAAAT